MPPRSTEIDTFMQVPLAQTLMEADIVKFDVPYDCAITNRADTRHGQRELRNQSSLKRAINHATRINPFRRAQIRDIGMRGTQYTSDGWDFSEASGMSVVFCEEFHEQGPAAIAEEAKTMVGDIPAHLTYDTDCLDPVVHATGTSTPEIGGMTAYQAQVLLRGLRDLNYVGADLVEVSPHLNVGDVTSLAQFHSKRAAA